MAQPKFNDKSGRPQDLDLLFERASKQYDDGKLLSAFRLFLAAAKAGDSGAQLALGNFYIDGVGVRCNRSRALYWYKRAYRQGYGPAASNIAAMFRDEKKLREALAWFARAVDLKDADANLEIAKIYLERNDRNRAKYFLQRTCRAKPRYVTEASQEEARRLLERLDE